MKNRLLLIILSLFMIIGLVFLDNNNFSLISVSQSYNDDKKEETTNDKEEEMTKPPKDLEKHNKELFNKIKKLEELAEDYIEERKIDANKVELCLQYIRKDRYNDEKWQGLLGAVDGDFVGYVNTKAPDFKLSNVEVLYDLKTNRPIDFVHMAATLNSYVRYGDTIPLVVTDLSTDYAGWAGDMLTFLEEMVNYRIENTPDEYELKYEKETEKEKRHKAYQDYAVSLLGTNNESTMSSSDLLADFDAYNMYHQESMKVKDGFYDLLVAYYQEYSVLENAQNRFETIREDFGKTEEEINSYVRPYLENILVRKLFIPDTTDAVTEEDIEVVLKAFNNYLLQYIYFDIEEVEEAAIVGKEVRIKIIDNHLDLAKVRVSPESYATAKISGTYIVVQPKLAGIATITVSSVDDSVTKSYELEILNIAPTIRKGLDKAYYFAEKEDQNISIKATGTNNVYTWYTSNMKDGDYTVLSKSTSNTLMLTTKADMDKMYIKCGVSNDGNEEVFTEPAIIYVGNSKIEIVVKKNNTAFIVGGIAIVILVILIFVYFKFIKGTDKDIFSKKKKDVSIIQHPVPQEPVAQGQQNNNIFYGYEKNNTYTNFDVNNQNQQSNDTNEDIKKLFKD